MQRRRRTSGLQSAEDWCKANGWTRICDIPSDVYSDTVTHTWDTLPDVEKKSWVRNYQQDAQAAWENYGRGGAYKVPVGYILDNGEFLTISAFHSANLANRGFMMVFDLRWVRAMKARRGG